ncbi:DMT family transporter [Aureibacter tunicatorum]|uniref:Drug/metabolite transporter (DMT)-like permease n=1 Tax=Aureibacter tunicatorum TaxID=866807 RepID=A0AAE3XGD1_9BACT|nr:DMT family transporter [Aureibacter tunicatorum]MDR6237096.1 drug/metabolite transporter (DMT)-like permease [Aureibacter tunicatorum]BDD06088.1 hypothetical protein AUTU_35710 [Aureibacter tunicatorum]
MEKKISLRLVVETLLALVSFGFTPVLIKSVSANPYTIGIVRLCITMVLTGIFLASFKEIKALSFKQVKSLALMGFLFGAHWVTYFISIKIGSASIAFLGLCTFGIHLILLGWIMKLRKPQWNDFLAVALVICGSLMVTPEFSLENNQTLGLLVAIISAVFFAGLPILQQRNSEISGSVRAFGQYGFALVLFLFTLPLTEWESLTKSDWMGLVALSVVCTFIAHTLWVKATTELPTTVSSIIYYLTLPLAMGISYMFLGEEMTLEKVGGALLIIVANIISILPKLKSNKTLEEKKIEQETLEER